MLGLRPGALDLTGRQRCQWGQVLRQLEAEGLLTASMPSGLERLQPGSLPEAWIDQAQAQGQVLPWLLRLLNLRPHDPMLHVLGRDLGLCVDSRERLQCSPGWRHWTGLDSAVQGLARRPGPAGPAEPSGVSLTMALEAWARRLLCLWRGGPAGSGLAWTPQALVLDLGAGQLLTLNPHIVLPFRAGLSEVRWQLGALPRHGMDEPLRAEARLDPAPGEAQPGLRCAGGQTLPIPADLSFFFPQPRLRQARAHAPLLERALLGRARAGPVLLLGADPGQPPQLCLALLQQRGAVWCHDASPMAMAGGGLCLDLQCHLLGCLRPMDTAAGGGLVLLWS